MRRYASRLLQHVFAGAMNFLCLLVLMGTSLIGCAQPTPAPKLNAVQSWIMQYAVPLKTTDPQMSLDDVQPLQPIIGTASIVGLGEATHGSHEFFTIKHRLLEFLVEKMGFTMFSLEGSWSTGEQMNSYVLTGQGNAGALLSQFLGAIWNTQELLDLVKWVRAYNADPRHAQKVRFTGFDCQLIKTVTFDQVTQYLQSVDPPSATRVASLYQGLRPDPAIRYTQYAQSYVQLPQSTKQQYSLNAQRVYDLLKAHEVKYEGRSSPQVFALVLQEARVIVQGAQYLSHNLNDPQSWIQGNQLREGFMAENIAWLHEHAEGGSKLVLWAHDLHIETGKQGTYTRMGMYLRQRYRSQYLPIGLSFSQGSFNAVGVDNTGHSTPFQSFTVQASKRESYNETFGQVGFSLYALDLRHIPAGSIGQWMNGPHGFFLVASSYHWDAVNSHYTLVSLPQCFDVLIHIQQVTASRLLPLQE